MAATQIKTQGTDTQPDYSRIYEMHMEAARRDATRVPHHVVDVGRMRSEMELDPYLDMKMGDSDDIMPAATEEAPKTDEKYGFYSTNEMHKMRDELRKMRTLRSRHRKQITQMNRVHNEDMRLIVNLRTQVEILDDIVERQSTALRGVNSILYPPKDEGCGDDEGNGGCL